MVCIYSLIMYLNIYVCLYIHTYTYIYIILEKRPFPVQLVSVVILDFFYPENRFRDNLKYILPHKI